MGFPVNWHGTVTPMAAVMKNPPLVSYYLALVGWFLGWSEFALHTALLLPAVGVVLGTYALARPLTKRPGEAALAAAFTPVLLVSSTTVMSDVLMLCGWVWSLHAWIRGVKERAPLLLALAVTGATATALTKYFGIALLPLFALYGILRDRQAWRWAPWLLVPVAALVAYQVGTDHLYGRGLLLDASSYAAAVRTRTQWDAVPKLLTGLAFTGGCLATALWYMPALWPRRALVGWALAALATTLALAAVGHLGIHTLRDATGVRWGAVAQVAVAIVVGVSVLLLAVLDLAQERSPEAGLLAAWTAGTLTFAVGLNWSVNARALLPLAPAFGILLARRLDRREALGVLSSAWTLRWALVPAAALALAVAWSDQQLAFTSRTAANDLAVRFGGRPGTVWFQGHWGFQYYAERLGFRALDFRHPAVQVGELIIKPDGITNPIELPQGTVMPTLELSFDGPSALGTMNLPLGAGFYSDVWGPLPFTFGAVPPERYRVYMALVPLMEP